MKKNGFFPAVPSRVVAIVVVGLVAASVLSGCGDSSERTGQATGDSTSTTLEIVPVFSDEVYTAETIDDLGRQGVAAIRATATSKHEEPVEHTANMSIMTMQTFEVDDVLWGEPPQAPVVRFAGGIAQDRLGNEYFQEDPETPQFEQGKSYLLVLMNRPQRPGEYTILGGASGRYKVTGERLEPAAVDQRGQPRREPERPAERELAGSSYEQARRALVEAHERHKQGG